MPIDQVEAIVAEWMIERPLKHLPRCRAEGLVPLLDFLSRLGVKLGVLSDYPAESKLKALGIGGRFSVVLVRRGSGGGRVQAPPARVSGRRGPLAARSRPKCSSSATGPTPTRRAPRPPACRASSSATATVNASRDFVSLQSLERLRDVLDDDHRR